jgi:hypothetical protein
MTHNRSILNNIIHLLLPGVILFLTASCESVLFIELEESDKLIVVNGTLHNQSPVSVQISRTRHILDNAPIIPLENATVTLFREGNLVEQLPYAGEGYYRSEHYVPDMGVAYRIEVENQGFPSVSASSSIPESIPIVSLDTSMKSHELEYTWWSSNESYLQMDVTIHDPAGEENYYLLDMMADRSRTEYRDTTVNYIDSLYHNGEWHYFVNDSTYTLHDIYRFSDQPFLLSDDLIVEEETGIGILFSDQLIDGKTYSIRVETWSYALESADSAVVDLRLHSISESYYKYLKTRQKHYDSVEDFMAVPVIVYSNVEAGTGFFGGYSTDVYTFTTFIPEYRYEEWWYYD